MIDELCQIALSMGKTLDESDIHAIYLSYFHLFINGESQRAVELYFKE